MARILVGGRREDRPRAPAARVLLILWMFACAAVAPAKVQAAAAKQTLQIQLKEFAFEPSQVVLRAGVPAEVTLVNRGVVEHEFMVYQMGAMAMGGMDPDKMHKALEQRSYFRGVQVRLDGQAKAVERHGKDLAMITLAPGQRVVLRFVPQRKGTFEMGGHLPGHYEAGMKGIWVMR